jgi:hypothetical protein
MTEADRELGWRNRPGTYRYSVSNNESNEITVTIQQDGRRTIHSNSLPMNIWLFGCSFSFGWGVTDGEEYPAKLDTLLGAGSVANFSVPGYSTAQGYLQFHRELARNGGKAPSKIVYGMASFHDARSVVTEDWLRTLTRAGRTQAWIKAPRAYLNPEGKVVISQPEAYPTLPFSDHLAEVHLLQSILADFHFKNREDTMLAVNLAIIKQWAKDAQKAGSQLIVIGLFMPRDRYFYARALQEEGIPYLEASFTGMPDPSTLVQGDGGHPIPAIHSEWAQTLSEKLQSIYPPQNAAISKLNLTNEDSWQVIEGVVHRNGIALARNDSLPGYIDSVREDRGVFEITGWAVQRTQTPKPLTIVLAGSLPNLDPTSVGQNHPVVLEVVNTSMPREDLIAPLNLPYAAATKAGFRLGISHQRLQKFTKFQLYAISDSGFRKIPCEIPECMSVER